MREDPRMIFQEWREEGFFRILVSRYLMDDENSLLWYIEVSSYIFV